MAKKYIDFTSNISVKLNGKTCSCPLVEIRSVGSDILQGCCYDEKAKCLTGQISDNPESTNGSNCITFWVACDEKDCTGGELVTRCFCDGNEDCGECEECGESGFCESRCAEGQFCDDDKCCDCLPGTCKNGKVCINGKCQCPKGSTEIDGVCRECDPDTFDVPCKICIDGKVVDVDCPEGVCDPESGECVDCCVTGQCPGSNKACKDKKCVCAPGYTFDNCSNECVVKPTNPCQDEGECGSCYSCTDYNPCTGFGTCTPTQCPSGFVCCEGDCIPECDCDGVSTCGVTSYCKEVNAFQCGCVDCPSNSCTEGDGSCEGDSNRNCICNPATQRCEQDPCAGVICPAGSTCINGQCVKDDVPCNSDLSLEKIEDGTNCDIKGSVTLECCPCPIITVEVTPTVSGDTITFDAIYSKDGERLSNNLPTNNIAGNEEPTTGRIRYEVIYQNITETLDAQGNITFSQTGTQNGPNGNSNNQFDEVTDELLTDVGTDGAPGTVLSTNTNADGTSTRVIRGGVRIDIYQTFTSAPNGCDYQEKLLKTFRLDSIDEFNNIQPFTAELVSTDCRNPLLIWKRDDLGLIRKIYKPTDENGYVEDILRGPDAISNDEALELPNNEGLLESCHTYTFEVDCDCGGPKSEEIKFCKTVDNFTAEQLDACATKVSYNVPATCDVNHDLQFRIVSNFGVESAWFGRDLGQSGVIEKDAPIEFLRLEMLCTTPGQGCEKTITFDSKELSLTPTYTCPNTITFPSTDSTGEVAVAQIFIGGAMLNGFTYTIPQSQIQTGFISYEIVWGISCKNFTDSFSWTCNCAGNPCAEQGRLCGTAIDACGNIRECGDLPTGTFGPWACVNNSGQEERTVTTYTCNADGTYTPSTTTESRFNQACQATITPMYRCAGGGVCVRDDANGTFLNSNCDNSCIQPSDKYQCVNGSCFQNDNGNYNSFAECQADCSLPSNYSCTNSGCVQDANGPYASAQECSAACDTTLGHCCDAVNGCTSNVIESLCNGTWSAISCAAAGCPTEDFGACCNGQFCTQETQSSCTGDYKGDGTNCATTNCNPVIQVGACCLPNNTCITTNVTDCGIQGGQYNGNGTSCSQISCGQPDCGCGTPTANGGCDCDTENPPGVCSGSAFSRCTGDPNGPGCICTNP